MEPYYLHAVAINKKIGYPEAYMISRKYIKKKNYFTEWNDYYLFRNIAKGRFEKDSFKTKKVDENLSLIFGRLKS